jgi:uncharacterized protein YbjT (DUF2867 family)
MEQKTIAIAGGSGFIGRAIARRLAAIPGLRVRVLSRNPERARRRLGDIQADFVRADTTDPATITPAIDGAATVVCAVQFDGYPVENPRRGLTFERIDLGATVALLEAAQKTAASRFIYISGAAADENSTHPGFRAKGRAERAIRESGLTYTIFRPSLIYGPEDAVINNLARALRFVPLLGVPGTGKQKLQPLFVEDLAACVALAIAGRGPNRIYEIGAPEVMTFDDLVRLIMDITGHRRPIFHIPEGAMRAFGAIGEKLPKPIFSRDAVTFVTADNLCDIAPLVADFGIKLTPVREGLSYLAAKR